MTARAVAARTVDRILHGGAFANVLLRSATKDLDERDAAATRSLTYGTVRWIGEAEAAVGAASARPLDRIQPPVRALVLTGSHELLRGHAPAPVVVSAWVDAAKELGLARATGFINGVLRAVAGAGPPELDTVAAAGFPRWLVDSLGSESEAFLAASNEPARVGHRVPPGTEPPAGDRLAGIDAAVLVDHPIPGLPVQDPASVAVVEALSVEPGMRVLDVAAAPGGKTAHLLDLVGSDGVVVAGELHARRAATGRRRVPGARWVRADGRHPPFPPGSFDRVLLDAPCSGLGTLRRRPELRLRITAEDVARLARVQADLVDAALGLVAPGGRLVYAVCTVTPEETTAITEGRPFRAPEGLPGRAAGRGWQLAPHFAETDGMFIAVTE
jgi:16S rRNA (cytosine967-C5)-methyltransferase